MIKYFLFIFLLVSNAYGVNGLEWTTGIEPGTPSTCEAPAGKLCYYVNCDAVADGAGTFASPYWGFEKVVGYYSAGSYNQGVAVGGDYIYVKGTCDVGTSVGTATGPYQQIKVARTAQLGTITDPLVIKSYLGTTRAIFDGEFDTTIATLGDASNEAYNLIEIKPLTATSAKAVRIQNILVKRATASGIKCSVDDGTVAVCDIRSVEFNDNIINPTGTEGALAIGISGTDYTQAHLVRNCKFINNNRNCVADGGNITGDTTCAAADNDGALSIYSANGSLGVGTIDIYNNLFDNNTRHIRDKHNGSNTKIVRDNIFKTSEGEALYDRQTGWVVYNNTFALGYQYVMVVTDDAPPTGKNRSLNFYNNSIYGSDRIIDIQPGAGNYADYLTWNIYNNAIDSIASTGRMLVIDIEGGGTPSFTPAKMTHDHNYYRISSASQTNFSFLAPTTGGSAGTQRTFAATMTYFSDTTSAITDPLFTSPATGDFSLQVGAASRTAGRAGSYIGAGAVVTPTPIPGSYSSRTTKGRKARR